MHVMTTKGFALLGKQQVGLAQPNITRVLAGAGYVEPEHLEQQTQILDVIAEMEVGVKQLIDGKIVRLPVQLSNLHLTNTALVRQIGVFSMDPDEGEILYQIVQYEQPVPIPAYASNNGGIILFDPELDVVFANGELVSAPLTPGFLITREEYAKSQPTEYVATITHEFDYDPVFALYQTKAALGTRVFGQGPFGGGQVISIPARYELLSARRVMVFTIPGFIGTPEIIHHSKNQYSLHFPGFDTNLLLKMR